MKSDEEFQLYQMSLWIGIAATFGFIAIMGYKIMFAIGIGLLVLFIVFKWAQDQHRDLKKLNKSTFIPKEQEPIEDPATLPDWYFNPTLSKQPLPQSRHMPIPSSTGVNALVITRTNHTPIYAEAMEPITSPHLLMHKPYRTIAVINDEAHVINANPLTDDDFEKPWAQCHADSLKLTLQVIMKAIADHQKEINIVYEYDGIFAYAAGYWQVNDNEAAKSYLRQLDLLSQHITVHFTKLTDDSISFYDHLISIANQH